MKKGAFYEMDAESKDLLLFDYLEGNLTPERARELEEALVEDPDLRSELAHWKESFVVQDFWPTNALEEQMLLKAGKTFTFTAPAAGFVVVFLASLFSFLPISEQPQMPLLLPVAELKVQAPAPEAKVQPALVPAQPKVPLGLTEYGVDKAATAAEKELPLLNHQQEVVPKRAVPQSIMYQQPLHVSLTEKVAGAVEAPHLTNNLQAQQLEPRKISKKAARQISRMKKKARQRKQAAEFLKGNRPYVVPLDTKNF